MFDSMVRVGGDICTSEELGEMLRQEGNEEEEMNITALTQATIIDGTGRDPIPNGSVVIEGDRIREVIAGPREPFHREPFGSTAAIRPFSRPDRRHVHAGAVEAILWSSRDEATNPDGHKDPQGSSGSIDRLYHDPGCRGADRDSGSGPTKLIPGRGCLSRMSPFQTGGMATSAAYERRLPQDMAGVATRVCDGVDEVRREAREQLRIGVDFLKVMEEGGPCPQ